MKTLKMLETGALLWVLIFVEMSITMIGLNLSTLLSYIIHYFLLIPIAFFCARFYYTSKDKMNGFLLGFFLVLIGIILDCIITVPLFIMPAGGNYMTYFSQIYLIAGLIEGIILFGIYDLIREK
jgi:hypothetical protein